MAATIRRIQEQDWVLVRALRLRSLAESPDAFAATLAEEQALGDEVVRARVRSNAEGTTTMGVLASVDGVEIGLAVGVRNADSVELNALWVAPEARGQRAGRALVEAVCAWARERGAAAVELKVALSSHAALALYRELGFEPTSEPGATCGARHAPALRMRLAL